MNMQGNYPPSIKRIGAITLGVMICFCVSLTAGAQVSIQIENGEIIIENGGFETQRLIQGAGKVLGDNWLISDALGNTYEACSSTCSQNSDGTWTCRGFESTTGEPSQDYLDMLQYLVDTFGAEICHDDLLDVDYISFPNEDDPVTFFITILTTETFNGIPIIDYFRYVELNSIGTYDPTYAAAKPSKNPFDFPNDPYYRKQWNAKKSRLAQAQWHSAPALEAVRIGVLDSGIGESQQGHAGLDGAYIQHESVAPTTGFPADHALGIISLLGDRSSENDGIIGLLGDSWNDYGCYENPPLLSQAPPQIFSYNVGDFGPINIHVARAIRQAVMQGVDIINLSISMASSPTIEEAIQEALNNNVLVVAAAGNYDANASWKPTKFPANMEGVIAVGAAGKNKSYSNFSADTGVDILAPGEHLVVGGPGNIWYYADGTSFAAPHVVATLAMMRAVSPDLSFNDAIAALQQYAQKKGDDGVGFLNALSSLNAVLPKSERVRNIKNPHTCSNNDNDDDDDDDADKTWDDEEYDDSIDDDLFQDISEEISNQIALYGNYPNPFNPTTTIRLALPAGQYVRLAVYNVLGQEVRVLAEGFYPQGFHQIGFDAGSLPSGIYLARLEADNTSIHHNMILMK